MNPELLFVLGLGIFGGTAGAWFFQKIRFPQVVGYIVIGLLVGVGGLQLIDAADISRLGLFNLFALGIIGFLVGGELQLPTFKKYGKQFTAILLGEGVFAFILVGILSFIVIYSIVHSVPHALGGCIVLGAIASATDPASTIDVLWEYRCKGVLTTGIIAIVALDDALAMTLYGLGTGTAQILTSDTGSIMAELQKVGIELFGALALGALVSFAMLALLKNIKGEEKSIALTMGLILLVITLSVYYKMDVILSTMMLGFMVTNLAPRRSEGLFKLVRSFSTPIYVMFFVLVGARLGFTSLPGWIWALIILYVIGRTLGKFFGAWLGGTISKSPEPVRKYLGLALGAQGGVAVGLSIMAASRLNNIHIHQGLSLGDVVIFTVTATTLIVQLAGPPFVKLAVKLADEIGRDVTEEDVLESWKVADVMEAEQVKIYEGDALSKVLDCFRDYHFFIYPVRNRKDEMVGILQFDSLKEVLRDSDAWQWLLATDIMTPVVDYTTPDKPLNEVYENMTRLKIDQMPVVDEKDIKKPLGILDMRHIRFQVNAELLTRTKAAA